MKIDKAKDYFKIGEITKIRIDRAVLVDGWIIVLCMRHETESILQTSLGKNKIFSSLDSVVSEVERIAGRVTYFYVGV